MRIGFVPLDTIEKKVGKLASTRFRVRWVSEYLPDSIISDNLKELKQCDVVIFQKRYSRDDIENAKLLKSLGIKLMLDFTDPEWYGNYLKGSANPPYIDEMIEIVDIVTLASRNLEKMFLETYKKPTRVINDRIDLNKHDIFKRHFDKIDDFKIVWHGSYGNLISIDLARPDIERLAAEFDIEFIVIYDRIKEFDLIKTPSNPRKITKIEWSENTINYNIIKGDVSINPRYNDWRNYKTNNKTVKAWALGVPCIEKNFYKEIKKLFKSADLRNKLAEQNRKIVEEKYDVRLSAEKITSIAKELIGYKFRKKKKKNEIVVVTAIAGGKDYLKEIEPQFREGADFIAFTNEDYLSDTWSVRQIRNFYATPCLDAKIYKVLIHQFTEGYKYVLWLDGTIIPKINIPVLIDKYLKDGDFVVFKHKERDCIFDELEKTINIKRDKIENFQRQKARYKDHPKHAGLYECGIMLRKSSERMETFNNAWWSEITAFSECDQTSFMYLVHKMKMKVNLFSTGNMYVSKLFKYETHAKPFEPVKQDNNKINLNKLKISKDTVLIKKITDGDYNVSKIGVLAKNDYIYVNKEIAEGLVNGHPEDFISIKSN